MSELRRTARTHWLDTPTGNHLHAPSVGVSGAWDDVEWEARNGWFACGRSYSRAFIPGLFSRLGAASRCRDCCRATGLPPGFGSPLNDDECRRLLGLDGGAA